MSEAKAPPIRLSLADARQLAKFMEPMLEANPPDQQATWSYKNGMTDVAIAKMFAISNGKPCNANNVGHVRQAFYGDLYEISELRRTMRRKAMDKDANDPRMIERLESVEIRLARLERDLDAPIKHNHVTHENVLITKER